MTAKEFNELSEEKRAEIWVENNIFVDERIIYNKSTIIIYSVFGFYVEVGYNVKDNNIESIKALENETDWDGFLKSVSIKELYLF